MAAAQYLAAQKATGDRIKQQRDQFSNTQLERRTLGYVKDRLLSLIALWTHFQANHRILQESTELDGGHSYFKEDYHGLIETVYITYENELQILLERLEGDAQGNGNPGASGPDGHAQTSNPGPKVGALDEDLDVNGTNPTEMVNPFNIETGRRQPTGRLETPLNLDSIFNNVRNSHTNLHNASTLDDGSIIDKFRNIRLTLRAFAGMLNDYMDRDISVSEDEQYFQTEILLEKWEVVKKLHQKQLLEHPDYDITPYSILEDQLEPVWFAYRVSTANRNKIQGNTAGTANKNQSTAKLPKLEVPKFESDCVKYNSFKQLFMKLVGSRTDLDNVEKFAYLKGQLEGEALRLVGSLPVEHGSYNSAWLALDGRFDNRHNIMMQLIERICNIKAMKNPSAEELKEIVDKIAEAVTSLTNMGLQFNDMANHFMYFHTESKIHPAILRIYENTLTVPGIPRKHEDFMKFLQCRVQNSSASKHYEPRSNGGKQLNSRANHNKEKSGTSLVSSAQNNSSSSVCCCKEKHLIFQCPKFIELTIDARYKKIKELKRCFNCLKEGHPTKECRGKACSKCNKKHNTLLHFEKKPRTNTTLISSAIKNQDFKHVFLATALIEVQDKNGSPVTVRALLDSGSQLNIITERMHRKLGIQHQSASMKISGIGSAAVESKKRLVLNIASKNSGFKTNLEVFVVNNMTTCQPAQKVDTDGWSLPKNISLADPKFSIPASVDLIIGGEIFFKLMSVGMISIGNNLPDLQNTVFGWVVTGKLLGLEQQETFVGVAVKQNLEQQLAKFWKIEEKDQPIAKFTQAEQDCEKFFDDTTTRNKKSGKFVVKLQFLKNPSILGKSEDMAVRRFLYLEKKLAKDPNMKKDYVAFMKEYEDLGHMKPIVKAALGEKFYVIPHHAVKNPGSSTTKFRVVFDASAKTSTNISLNEILANGPMLQDDLFSILVRFRKHQYVFSADITKMYRQVLVHPEDQKWQVIVWRENPQKPLQYYKLKTLTYGTTCASYLAIKALQQLAEEHKHEYGKAAIVAKRDFNVDDVMTGSDDLWEAQIIQDQLMSMCHKASFKLHKWCANHQTLLDQVPKEIQEVSLDINADNTETKALGIKWIPSTDQFMLKYEPREYKKITKRTVLSETAQLFDPLGLVNPVIVLAKIFLQELWSLKLDWDAALPTELHTKWTEFRKELLKLNNVSVPRHMVIENAVDIQMHGFSDASTRAYGTAIYLRSTSETGEVQVTLVCSKSRVAPVNATTLPRLELCAGITMVQLAKKLNTVLELNISNITYWTDSEVVLSWLYSDGTYKTFVANRIADIKRKTSTTDWKYVNTKLNPADLISRGVLPEQLIKSELWWHGPSFLKEREVNWPKIKPEFVREQAEERTIKTVLITKGQDEHVIDRISHRNSFRTLQRVVAYMKRCYVKKDNRIAGTHLDPEELKKALNIIIQYCQKQSFSEEIKMVKNEEGSKTKFASLVPFISDDGIMRVGGRLEAAQISFDQKHPALIPKDHYITRMIMENLHINNYHAGPQALLAITRQKFWPENGKRLAHSVVRQCVLCARSKPKLMEQIMGQLPAERVMQARPFINVGVDFAGPITIHYKIRGKKPTKAYVCIFVCFTTKAVHIEAAADLTTEGFICCLKRFIARRGAPSKIFSDNATNFTSANSQLTELKELMTNSEHKEKVMKYCQDHLIEWRFIPPRSPHFGGLHEASVKSCKHHLRKILHTVDLTFDELMTVLAEIEAILNSRPLTPLSNDPNDLQPLTAGHFLIGMPMNCIDERKLPETSKTKVWTKMNLLKHEFWRRWSKEYLAELQQRTKWIKEKGNIKIGSMVILKEDNTPPLHWKFARIIKTFSDSVGNIRVVEVKTTSGDDKKPIILKRAIHEISPLPVETGEEKAQEPSEIKEQDEKRTNKKKNLKIADSKLNPSAPSFEPRITRSRARQAARLPITIVAILGLIVGMIIGALGEPCVITSFENNPGLYFEENGQLSLTNEEWNIICYIQLDDYWNQGITIKKLLDRMDTICPQLDPIEYCEVTRKQLWAQWVEIQKRNNLIRDFSTARKRREVVSERNPEIVGQNRLSNQEAEVYEKLINKQLKTEIQEGNKQMTLSRSKRGWANVIGSGLKKVTGVLDDDDAKAYEDKFKGIEADYQQLHKLVENQTTIQQITQNIIRREENGMTRQLKRLENEVELLHNKNQVDKADIFSELAIQTVALMNVHQEAQSILIDMFMETHKGKVSTTVLSPEQLRQNMITIAANISKELMIPGDDRRENIARVYTTLTAKLRITTSRIVIKVTMPLLLRDSYKLYHIIPVPFTQDEDKMKIINIQQEFIGINAKQDRYYMISHVQKEACKQYAENWIICEQNHPIFNTQNGEAKCEMAIFSHQSKGIPPKCRVNSITGIQIWSKLNKPNHFLFTVKNKTVINRICKQSVLACSIEKTGIISLPQQCIIQSGNIEISAHNVHTSELPTMHVPGINISDVLMENVYRNITPRIHEIYQIDPELDRLDALIQTQRFNEQYIPRKANWHDVHHYVLVYITLTIVMAGLGWYIYANKVISCIGPCCQRKRIIPSFDHEDIERFTAEMPQPAARVTNNELNSITFHS